MKLFKDISKADYKNNEHEVSKYWEEINLLEQSIETRKNKPKTRLLNSNYWRHWPVGIYLFYRMLNFLIVFIVCFLFN